MEKESNEVEISAKEGTNTVYEVSYLLLPTISQEQVSTKVATLKETLVSFGAKLISDEDPILIDLAYPMTKVAQTTRHKANQGYFGWVKFEIGKDGIASVKKFLDNNLDVLRYLIIKTVKENTLLNGKMKLKSEDKTKKFEDKDEEVSEEVEVDDVKEDIEPQELDKSIDDLVVA